MPVGIQQPSNQIKLTNVSYVRMKKGKKRFEIACYKNKLLDYRSGIETDLDNVLQVPQIFIDVNKGQAASKGDLQKAWPGMKNEQIIDDIIKNGEMQVGEKERQAELDRIHNEVLDFVAGQVRDPATRHPYTSSMIEKALEQLSSQSAHQQTGKKAAKGKGPIQWTGVVSTRNAKSQGLDAIKALVAHQPLPIERIPLDVTITCSPPSVLSQSIEKAPIPTKRREAAEAKGLEPAKPAETVGDFILDFVKEKDEKAPEKPGVDDEKWQKKGGLAREDYKAFNDFIDQKLNGAVKLNLEVSA